MTVGLGCFLILLGAVMCNFAFHAEKLSRISHRISNATDTELVSNSTKLGALKSLTFIGPSLIGLGIFVIIIACVLLLDRRDKILKDYTDSMIKTQQEISMELSYRIVRTPDIGKPASTPRKSNSKYSELEEISVASFTKSPISRSSFSSPCFHSYQSEMHDIEELPPGQEIELSTLEEHCEPIIRAPELKNREDATEHESVCATQMLLADENV